LAEHQDRFHGLLGRSGSRARFRVCAWPDGNTPTLAPLLSRLASLRWRQDPAGMPNAVIRAHAEFIRRNRAAFDLAYVISLWWEKSTKVVTRRAIWKNTGDG